MRRAAGDEGSERPAAVTAAGTVGRQRPVPFPGTNRWLAGDKPLVAGDDWQPGTGDDGLRVAGDGWRLATGCGRFQGTGCDWQPVTVAGDGCRPLVQAAGAGCRRWAASGWGLVAVASRQ